jgi:hypothetical protein
MCRAAGHWWHSTNFLIIVHSVAPTRVINENTFVRFFEKLKISNYFVIKIGDIEEKCIKIFRGIKCSGDRIGVVLAA